MLIGRRKTRTALYALLLVELLLSSCSSVVLRETPQEPASQSVAREVWRSSSSTYEMRVSSASHRGDMVELTGDIIERVEVERRLESSSVVVEHYYPYTVARDVKWKLYLVGSVLRAPMKIVTLFLAPSRRTHYKDWGTENFQYNLLTTLGTVVPGILPEPADYGLSLGFSEQPLTRRVRGPWNEVDKSRVVKTIPFSASNMVLRLSDDHRFKTDVLGRFSFAVPAEEWASRKDLIELRLELELEPRKIQASLVLIDPKEIQ